MKLLSEFGRGKDKRKRIRKNISMLTKTPAKSTQRAADIGGLVGLGAGTVLGAKALSVANKNNLLRNPTLSPIIIGAGALGVLSTSTALGAIGGIGINNKIRKKSLYE